MTRPISKKNSAAQEHCAIEDRDSRHLAGRARAIDDGEDDDNDEYFDCPAWQDGFFPAHANRSSAADVNLPANGIGPGTSASFAARTAHQELETAIQRVMPKSMQATGAVPQAPVETMSTTEYFISRLAGLMKSMARSDIMMRRAATVPGLPTAYTYGMLFSRLREFRASPSVTTFTAVLWATPWAHFVPQAWLTLLARGLWDEGMPQNVKDLIESDDGTASTVFIATGYLMLAANVVSQAGELQGRSSGVPLKVRDLPGWISALALSQSDEDDANDLSVVEKMRD